MAALVLTPSLAVACGEPAAEQGPPASELERSAEPPFELSPGFRVAGRGDDLVVIQYGTNRAAIRWSDDSTWSELPPVAEDGDYEFVTIGPTVVAGGATCEGDSTTDGSCTEGAAAVFRLSEDLTEWTRLEMPEIPVGSEPEVTASIGPQALGEFQIQSSDISVDADGTVTVGEVRSYDGTGFACLVDGRFVNMSTRTTEPSAEHPLGLEVVSAITTRPINEPDAEWDLIDIGTEVIPAANVGRICGAGRVSLVPDSGTTEWIVDVAARTVRAIESNSPQVVGAAWFQRPGGQAESPDGRTLYFADAVGGIARRTGIGPWESIGVPSGRVWATDSAVWTFDETRGEFVQLEPPA